MAEDLKRMRWLNIDGRRLHADRAMNHPEHDFEIAALSCAVRTARVMLGMSRREFVEIAQIEEPTLIRLERGETVTVGVARVVAATLRALDVVVEFHDGELVVSVDAEKSVPDIARVMEDEELPSVTM